MPYYSCYLLSVFAWFCGSCPPKWTDTNTEFPPTQCILLTWYSPKGPINRPRMNQDFMLCGSLPHQILPAVRTTLYLNAVRKGERKTKGGKGRGRKYIYSTKNWPKIYVSESFHVLPACPSGLQTGQIVGKWIRSNVGSGQFWVGNRGGRWAGTILGQNFYIFFGRTACHITVQFLH